MPKSGTITAAQIKTAPDRELETLIQHEFPNSIFDLTDLGHVILSVHGVGKTKRQAMENALIAYNDMKFDGQSLPQMLDDVVSDLAEPGMGRERHDSLIEILDMCSAAVNSGVLTHTLNWIMVPAYTRQIEDLRRRVSARLGMMAQQMKDRDAAKTRAGQKAKPRTFERPDGNAWEIITGKSKRT